MMAMTLNLASPSESKSEARADAACSGFQLSLETMLYVSLLAVAAILRLAALGDMPLDDRQGLARLALLLSAPLLLSACASGGAISTTSVAANIKTRNKERCMELSRPGMVYLFQLINFKKYG